jgi:hypothetical protein
MTYPELKARLALLGIKPVLHLEVAGDNGLIVHLGDPKKIVFPERVPPGAIPLYLENGHETVLKEEYAQFIIDHFRNGSES